MDISSSSSETSSSSESFSSSSDIALDLNNDRAVQDNAIIDPAINLDDDPAAEDILDMALEFDDMNENVILDAFVNINNDQPLPFENNEDLFIENLWPEHPQENDPFDHNQQQQQHVDEEIGQFENNEDLFIENLWPEHPQENDPFDHNQQQQQHVVEEIVQFENWLLQPLDVEMPQLGGRRPLANIENVPLPRSDLEFSSPPFNPIVSYPLDRSSSSSCSSISSIGSGFGGGRDSSSSNSFIEATSILRNSSFLSAIMGNGAQVDSRGQASLSSSPVSGQFLPQATVTPNRTFNQSIDMDSESAQDSTGGSVAASTDYPWYSVNFAKDPKEYFCDTITVDNASIVAQIVGKQGSKIKHLIAKYSTSIRTPICSNGEEPVFIIKGKHRNVYLVKKEIQKAERHFLAIEQAKRVKLAQIMNVGDATTMRVYIPPHYIGLVVGRNGRVVREWQLLYNVYIETPKAGVHECFQIHGALQRVQQVAQLIYDQIAKRASAPLVKRMVTPNELRIDDTMSAAAAASHMDDSTGIFSST